MPKQIPADPLLLQAALIGLQQMHAEVEGEMAELRRRLGTGPAPAVSTDNSAPLVAPRRKRRMSAAARRRIALAQKKRWAAYRKAKEQPKPAAKTVVPAKPTRKSAPNPGAKAKVKASSKQAPQNAGARKKVIRKTAARPKAKVAAKKTPAPKPANVNSATRTDAPGDGGLRAGLDYNSEGVRA